jgi:hypothetical protein
MSEHHVRWRWIKGEVDRIARVSCERALKAAGRPADPTEFAPTAVREAVAARYYAVLWSRTSHYLTSGSDQVTAVLTPGIATGATRSPASGSSTSDGRDRGEPVAQ